MDGSGSTADDQEARPAAERTAGGTSEITAAEEAAAEEAAADPELGDADGTVAAHYREMTQRGAHQKGEGRVP
jgi:hypothetical protein